MENGHSAETGGRLQQHRREKVGVSAKKIPEAANPRGAEDSSCFRGRLDSDSISLQASSNRHGENSKSISKSGQYVFPLFTRDFRQSFLVVNCFLYWVCG